MTELDALRMLNAYKKCCSLQTLGNAEICDTRKCDECSLCYEQGTNGEHNEAIAMAIKALEKRIPQKPEWIDKDLEEWSCPHCKEYNQFDFYNYCPVCGQKLNWKD